MGHIHLVRLPNTPAWRVLVAQLRGPAPDAGQIAATTATGAAERLDRLRGDPSLAYCFWLLARIAGAARRPDFVDALADVGLRPAPSDSAIGFVARVSARARGEVERHPESGPFGDLASLALRRALTETVGTEGRSLFGASLADLEDALRKHATPDRFGGVARRFFGDFLARTLRFYVDKELSLAVGPGWGLATSAEADGFADDLDRYARQTAVIVERFAADWFALHDWQSGGLIDRNEAQGFVAEALRKLRAELDEPRP